MEISSVVVRLDSHGHGQVFLNGEPVRNLTGIAFKAGVDQINEVTLTLLVEKFEFHGVADVTTMEHEARTFVEGEPPCG